jgi:hypothetical protein
MNFKSLLFVLGLMLMSNLVTAQSYDDYLEVVREALKVEKKAVVASEMQLAETETAAFWELYNQYNTELYKIHTLRVNIIKEFANGYDNLSNEQADKLWLNTMDYKAKLLSLNKSYYKKFKKILPATKAARYFQIENKIGAIIDAELANEIPLVNDLK